jgi:hypothetical protein
MNEAETRAEHIDPALRAAGWGVVEGSRIRREYLIAPGRIKSRLDGEARSRSNIGGEQVALLFRDGPLLRDLLQGLLRDLILGI